MRPQIKASLAALAVSAASVAAPFAGAANAAVVPGATLTSGIEQPLTNEGVVLSGAFETKFARTVKVQEFIANRWTTVNSTRTDKAGNFKVTIAAPLAAGVTKKVRMVAPATRSASAVYPAVVSQVVRLSGQSNEIVADAPASVPLRGVGVVTATILHPRTKAVATLQVYAAKRWTSLTRVSTSDATVDIPLPAFRDETTLYRVKYTGGKGVKAIYSNVFAVAVGTGGAHAEDPDVDGLTNAREQALGTNPFDADTDNDGVFDGQEVDSFKSNPLIVDTDGDGLSDNIEYNQFRTSLVLVDTDKDGISDLDEIKRGIMPKSADKDADGDRVTDNEERRYKLKNKDVDTDADGLNDGDELWIYGTDPKSFDTDGDGISDGDEIKNGTDPFDGPGEPSDVDLTAGPDIDQDGIPNDVETGIGTDPYSPDTDADGLSDGAEVGQQGTDPVVADTDADGLSDGTEVNQQGTDPVVADTDADGLSDGTEVTETNTNPVDADTDNDALVDGVEIEVNADPRDADTDDDALVDGDEVATGGDVQVPDTDADGIKDGVEVNDLGTSPAVVDTDGDDIQDGNEAQDTATDPTDADTDNDGLSDSQEVIVTPVSEPAGETPTEGPSNPSTPEPSNPSTPEPPKVPVVPEVKTEVKTDPLNVDTDGDGLKDKVEVVKGTDPVNPDTDHDGVIDSDEGTKQQPSKRKWLLVATGKKHSCGIDANDGGLYCWGDNKYGQLGIGTVGDDEVEQPKRVGVASDWASVTAEDDYTCATNTSGSLFCWGENQKATLGVGDTKNRSVPTLVGKAGEWKNVSAGRHHACGVKKNRTLWCWGDNSQGALKILTSSRLSPTQATPLAAYDRVYALNGKTMAVRIDGVLEIWGLGKA